MALGSTWEATNRVIRLAAQLATLPLQACQLLSKLGEELEPVICRPHPSESSGPKRTWQLSPCSSFFSSSEPLQQPFRRALHLLLSLLMGRYKALPMR